MFLAYLLFLMIPCLVTIFVRILYLLFAKHGINKRYRTTPIKTMIILGSGGHTAEMLRIVNEMNCDNYSPRIYVCGRTDKISSTKIKELEGERQDFTVIEIARSREVLQSYITSVWTTIVATLESIPVLLKERPNLILCNGPGTCVPLCIIAFVLKVFCVMNTTIIFIESFCRVKTFSLSGKILYFLVDHIIVQWPSLSKPLYQRPHLV